MLRLWVTLLHFRQSDFTLSDDSNSNWFLNHSKQIFTKPVKHLLSKQADILLQCKKVRNIGNLDSSVCIMGRCANK